MLVFGKLAEKRTPHERATSHHNKTWLDYNITEKFMQCQHNSETEKNPEAAFGSAVLQRAVFRAGSGDETLTFLYTNRWGFSSSSSFDGCDDCSPLVLDAEESDRLL